jgi:hypothetical protein
MKRKSKTQPIVPHLITFTVSLLFVVLTAFVIFCGVIAYKRFWNDSRPCPESVVRIEQTVTDLTPKEPKK